LVVWLVASILMIASILLAKFRGGFALLTQH